MEVALTCIRVDQDTHRLGELVHGGREQMCRESVGVIGGDDARELVQRLREQGADFVHGNGSVRGDARRVVDGLQHILLNLLRETGLNGEVRLRGGNLGFVRVTVHGDEVRCETGQLKIFGWFRDGNLGGYPKIAGHIDALVGS